MKTFRICTLVGAAMLLAACSDNSSSQSAEEGELIPRSTSEKASYYLITTEPDGEHLRTVHSRVSSVSQGYSVTRIDCDNSRYQDLGYGEGSQSNIKMYDNVQWTDLVSGSSKADLAAFVCDEARE